MNNKKQREENKKAHTNGKTCANAMLHIALLCAILLFTACGNQQKTTSVSNDTTAQPAGPSFCPDSAYAYCAAQCDFGPRTMNSDAHKQCGKWLVAKFQQFGMNVTEQKTTLNGYDGTPLQCTNIIASYKPSQKERILLCAHWDSRPWADNDPDSANWRKPVMAANDGASGVAVMLEIARLLQAYGDSLAVGVDFVCFDAEDWGTPQWSESDDDAATWALGANYWAHNPHHAGYTARFGILLDMVGAQGASFYQESVSKHYAPAIVDKVWAAARVVGYGSYFPTSEGGMITDDHVPVNEIAKIPTIDIIPYYPDCQESSFGPTWHTIADTMEHIDSNTLQAVGQTVIQVLFTER